MQEIIDVNTGEVKVGSGRVILRSVAIGSCVVIAAYDCKKKIGAMAHIMLPGSAPKKSREKTRYAADAIDKMMKQMSSVGAKTGDIEVCLVGGANVLQRKDDNICKENIKSTTSLLNERNIAVRTTVLGGTERKGVFLDVESGDMSYTEGDGKEKPLLK